MHQLERCFHADIKGLQVAIINANRVRARIAERSEHQIDLLCSVHLYEYIEVKAMRAIREALKFGRGERGGDQEDGICVVSAGFDDLILVYSEVFAQAGYLDRCRGDLEVAQAALEPWLIGENGQGRRAAKLVACWPATARRSRRGLGLWRARLF